MVLRHPTAIRLLAASTLLALAGSASPSRSAPPAQARARSQTQNQAQPQPPREPWRLLAAWPARPQARPPGVFGAAAGLDVAPDGRIWVADTADHSVHVLDGEGRGLRKIGAPAPDSAKPEGAADPGALDPAPGPSAELGRFDAPRDVAIAAGRVHVSDTGNGRVQVFDLATGGFLAAWPVGGAPGGIAVSADGTRVHVADAQARRLTVLDAAGSVVASWGPAGTSGPGGRAHDATVDLVSPTGVDVRSDADGAPERIYVADPGAQRVWLLEPDGRVDDIIDRASSTPLYDAPRDVVVADDGAVVLTTTFRRLYGFRQGRFLRLPLPGPYHYGGVGLALGPDEGLVSSIQDARAAWTGVLSYADRGLVGVRGPDARWGNVPAALGALQGARRVAVAGRGAGAAGPVGGGAPGDPADPAVGGAFLLDRWPRVQRWDGRGLAATAWEVADVLDVAARAMPGDGAPGGSGAGGDALAATASAAASAAAAPAGPHGAWLFAPDALLRLDADGRLAPHWRAGSAGPDPDPAPGPAPAAGTWLVAGAVAGDGSVAAVDAGRERLLQWAAQGPDSPPSDVPTETGLGGVIVDIAPADDGWWVADRGARALRRLDRTGRERGRVPVAFRMDRLAADATGQRLALLGDDGWVRVLEADGTPDPDAPDGPGGTTILSATLVAAFVGAPGGAAVDLDVDAAGRVLVVDGVGSPANDADEIRRASRVGQDDGEAGASDGGAGRLLWWGPHDDPDAPRPAPPAGDDRCALRPDKRAAPDVVSGAVRVGEPVTVTLSLDGDCPSESAVLDVALVLDASGSMEGPKLAAARGAAVAFSAELDFSRVRVAVIPFADEAELALGLSADRAAVVRAVAGIQAGGGTDIGDALRTASRELSGARARTEAAPVIVLMTDGRPESASAARSAAEAARAAGATLYAIGLGDDVDAALLAELAAAPERVFAVPSEAELARVYTRIARRLATTTLLRAITIDDELPPDMDYVSGSAVPPATVIAPPPGTPPGADPARGVILRWTLRDVPPAGLRLRYRVLPRAAGVRPTNVVATGDYEDGIGFEGRVRFPVPRVRVVGDRLAYLPFAVQNRCPARRVDVVLVLDASSSMLAPAVAGADAGSKLAAAREAARAFVGYLALPRDRAAVVAFDAAARLVHPLSGDGAAVDRAIAAIRAGQGTRIDRGLAAAADALEAARRPGAVPVVVLLTDGRPAAGSAEAARAGAARLRAAGVTIFSVGLGADVDGGFLVDLAGAPERYLYAPTAIGLYDIYRGIALGLPCD